MPSCEKSQIRTQSAPTEVMLSSKSVMDASASVRTLDLGVGRSAYAAAGASRGSRYGVKSGMLETVVAVSLMLLASACFRSMNIDERQAICGQTVVTWVPSSCHVGSRAATCDIKRMRHAKQIFSQSRQGT